MNKTDLNKDYEAWLLENENKITDDYLSSHSEEIHKILQEKWQIYQEENKKEHTCMGLTCPNCNAELVLEEQRSKVNGGVYDKYTCEHCTHIVVLDERFEEVK